MPKQRLKQWLPKPEELRKNKVFGVFTPFLADPRLWYLNRAALVRAIFVGVACAFFPLPGQMPLAIFFALLLRANIPMSIALTWITNPITALPVYWFAYWVGATLLGEPAISVQTVGAVLADASWWVLGKGPNPFATHQFFSLKVFALGLVVTAALTSLLAALAFNVFWRYRIGQNWKKRRGYRPGAALFRLQKLRRKNQHKK